MIKQETHISALAAHRLLSFETGVESCRWSPAKSFEIICAEDGAKMGVLRIDM